MLRRLVIVLVLFSFTSSANAMTLLFKDYKAPKDQTEKLLYGMDLDGVKEGIITLNVVMPRPLFCMPGNLALTDEQAEDIMMRQARIETDPDTAPIAIILIAGLIKKFPCNGKH